MFIRKYSLQGKLLLLLLICIFSIALLAGCSSSKSSSSGTIDVSYKGLMGLQENTDLTSTYKKQLDEGFFMTSWYKDLKTFTVRESKNGRYMIAVINPSTDKSAEGWKNVMSGMAFNNQSQSQNFITVLVFNEAGLKLISRDNPLKK